MTKVKLCGVTLLDDAARVGAAGADFIGFNFWPQSKRHLAPERAPMLARAARAAGTLQVVGVFVDATIDDILAVHRAVDLDIIQLHGYEGPELVAAVVNATKRPVWKAISVRTAEDVERLEIWPADAILLDAPTPGRGGSGTTFDWALAQGARRRYPAMHIVLAGGITPDNVGEAIAAVQPWAIDVASGVEAGPGVKDPDKITRLVAAARAAGG